MKRHQGCEVPYLLFSCRWPGTSGTGSIGSDCAGACPPHSPCCHGRRSSGPSAQCAWRSPYIPHSCARHSACLLHREKRRWNSLLITIPGNIIISVSSCNKWQLLRTNIKVVNTFYNTSSLKDLLHQLAVTSQTFTNAHYKMKSWNIF